jgi:RNA polymerase sigma factor (sigma-70 family)
MAKVSRKTDKDYLSEAYGIAKKLRFKSAVKDYHYMCHLSNVIQLAEFEFNGAKASMSTWKFICAKRDLIKNYRTKLRKPLWFSGKTYNNGRPLVSQSTNPFDKMLLDEIIEYVNTCSIFSKLHRDIFRIHFIEGKMQSEIAREQKVSRQNIEQHIKKIRNIIKEKFHD